jgi:large-conductance mechanosensitive channel
MKQADPVNLRKKKQPKSRGAWWSFMHYLFNSVTDREPSLVERSFVLAADAAELVRDSFMELYDYVREKFSIIVDEVERSFSAIVMIVQKIFERSKMALGEAYEFVRSIFKIFPQATPDPKVSKDVDDAYEDYKKQNLRRSKKMNKKRRRSFKERYFPDLDRSSNVDTVESSSSSSSDTSEEVVSGSVKARTHTSPGNRTEDKGKRKESSSYSDTTVFSHEIEEQGGDEENNTFFDKFFSYILVVMTNFVNFVTHFSVKFTDVSFAYNKLTTLIAGLTVWERADVGGKCKRVAHWLWKTATGEPLFADIGVKEDFLEKHKVLYTAFEEISKLTNPPLEDIVAIEEMYKDYKLLYNSFVVGHPKEVAWARAMYQNMEKQSMAFSPVSKSQRERIKPVSILLSGGAGTGKSHTQRALSADVDALIAALIQEMPDKVDMEAYKKHSRLPSVFPRNCMQEAPEFDDPFSGARWVFFHEWCSSTSAQDNEKWTQKLFAWMDTQPIVANMARCESKGQVFVEPSFIVATSNLKQLQLPMKDPGAFTRRLDLWFDVTYQSQGKFDIRNAAFTLRPEVAKALQNPLLAAHEGFSALATVIGSPLNLAKAVTLDYYQLVVLTALIYMERISPEHVSFRQPSYIEEVLKQYPVSRCVLAHKTRLNVMTAEKEALRNIAEQGLSGNLKPSENNFDCLLFLYNTLPAAFANAEIAIEQLTNVWNMAHKTYRINVKATPQLTAANPYYDWVDYWRKLMPKVSKMLSSNTRGSRSCLRFFPTILSILKKVNDVLTLLKSKKTILIKHENNGNVGSLYIRQAYIVATSKQRELMRSQVNFPLGPSIAIERLRVASHESHVAWLKRRRARNLKRQREQTRKKAERRAALRAAANANDVGHVDRKIKGISWADVEDDNEEYDYFDTYYTKEDEDRYQSLFYEYDQEYDERLARPRGVFEEQGLVLTPGEAGFMKGVLDDSHPKLENKWYWYTKYTEEELTSFNFSQLYELYYTRRDLTDDEKRIVIASAIYKMAGAADEIVRVRRATRFGDVRPLLKYMVSNPCQSKFLPHDLVRAFGVDYDVNYHLWYAYMLNLCGFSLTEAVLQAPPANGLDYVHIATAFARINMHAPTRVPLKDIESIYHAACDRDAEIVLTWSSILTTVGISVILSAVIYMFVRYVTDNNEVSRIEESVAALTPEEKERLLQNLCDKNYIPQSFDPRKAPQEVKQTVHAATLKYEEQGGQQDPLYDKVHSNMYMILSSTGTHVVGYGHFAFGNVFQAPRHVWKSVGNIVRLLPICMPLRKCIKVDMSEPSTYTILYEDAPSDKFQILIKSAQPHCSLLKHYVPAKYLNKRFMNVVLLYGDKQTAKPTFSAPSDLSYKTTPLIWSQRMQLEASSYFFYEWDGAQPGICGAVLTATYKGKFYILGDHSAGSTGSCGVAMPLTSELMAKYSDPLSREYNLLRAGAHHISFSLTDGVEEQGFTISQGEIAISKHTSPYVENNIMPTPFQNFLFEGGSLGAPAKCGPKELNTALQKQDLISKQVIRGHSPLVYALSEEYADPIADVICKGVDLSNCTPISHEEAQFDHPKLTPPDNSTSEGVRLPLFGVKKANLTDPDYVGHAILERKYQEDVDKTTLTGEYPYQLNCVNLKGEVRPLEKVEVPRPFSITDAFDNYKQKRMTGDFVARFKLSFMFAYMACGVNPSSTAWQLAYYLFMPELLVAGDIKGNDYTHLRWVMIILSRVIRRAYPDERHATDAEWCFLSCIYAIRGMFGKGYLLGSGNSSGNWLTTFFNTVQNLIFHCLIIVKGSIDHGEDPLENLKRFLAWIYSDDNVSALVGVKWWTNTYVSAQFMKLFGVTFTDPDKREGEGIPENYTIDQISFLCRRFVERGGNVYAPLSRDSLLQQLFWVRCPDKMFGKSVILSQLQINLDNIMRELLEWEPREAYELVDKIRKFISHHRLKLVVNPLDYYRAAELKLIN